jgi:hypothetical protein
MAILRIADVNVEIGTLTTLRSGRLAILIAGIRLEAVKKWGRGCHRVPLVVKNTLFS